MFLLCNMDSASRVCVSLIIDWFIYFGTQYEWEIGVDLLYANPESEVNMVARLIEVAWIYPRFVIVYVYIY